jgi:hypothetical protein
MKTMKTRCPGRPAKCDDWLDPVDAARFLQREAAILRRAVVCPGDRDRARQALRSQELAHDTWLTLVRRAETAGHTDTARMLGALYALHGKIGGFVERGGTPLLEPQIRERVGRLLTGQLHQRTGQAVRHLMTRPALRRCRHGRPGGDVNVAPSGSRRPVGSPLR